MRTIAAIALSALVLGALGGPAWANDNSIKSFVCKNELETAVALRHKRSSPGSELRVGHRTIFGAPPRREREEVWNA